MNKGIEQMNSAEICAFFPEASLDLAALKKMSEEGADFKSFDPESSPSKSYLKAAGDDGSIAKLDVFSDGSYNIGKMVPKTPPIAIETASLAPASAAADRTYRAFKENTQWYMGFDVKLNASNEIVWISDSSVAKFKLVSVLNYTAIIGYRPQKASSRVARCKFELTSPVINEMGSFVYYASTFLTVKLTTTASGLSVAYEL